VQHILPQQHDTLIISLLWMLHGGITKVINLCDMVLKQDKSAWVKRQPICEGNLIGHIDVVHPYFIEGIPTIPSNA
jgi:hypothetical protein